MSDDLQQYKREIETQQEQLLLLLAQIGLEAEYDLELPEWAEGSALGELFLAVKLVADQLKLLTGEQNERIQQLQQKEAIILAQRDAILELSTPVIQVQQGILIMPLVGTLDTMRAQQLLEQLLHSVAENKALVVILDITGVPMVDTSVASHLIKTVRAVGILGAKCILTGMSPSMAQSLVKMGINLADIRTHGTLQSGLENALKLRGLQITPRASKVLTRQ